MVEVTTSHLPSVFWTFPEFSRRLNALSVCGGKYSIDLAICYFVIDFPENVNSRIIICRMLRQRRVSDLTGSTSVFPAEICSPRISKASSNPSCRALMSLASSDLSFA
jgi:hypothetical protein